MKRYLENMTIGDAKRLADSLGLPVTVLLDASLRLYEDRGHVHVEGVGDQPQLGNWDVAVAV